MYTRRRILAVLVVLLLLALLLPRACQALMGSDNEAGGPGGEQQQAGAAGTDSGAGEGNDSDDAGDDAGTGDDAGANDANKDEGAESKDEPSDRGAPFLDDRSDGENGSGDDEAAPDLLALVTPLETVSDEGAPAGEEAGSGGGSSGTGGEPQAAEQPISENQFALAASPAPARQPSSGGERAPARRAGPAETAPAETTPVAEQDATSLGERIRARADRLTATPVAEPAALVGSGPGQAVVEPATAETFGPSPVAPSPVAPAPVAPSPVVPAPAAVPAASVSSGPDFAPTRVGAVRGVRAVPAALPPGPRLAGTGPTGTPGPAF